MTALSDTGLPRMTALVHEVVAEILPALPRERITGDRHPKDLGADSVDRVEIILTLLDRIGVQAPMAAFSEIPNLDALAGYLLQLTEGGPAS